MHFRITGLSLQPFAHLIGQSEAELAAQNILRVRADESPGFPDRIELREAKIGETLLLLNYVSQSAATPYRATHAIYINEAARSAYDRIDEIPEVMTSRILSLRGFCPKGMMIAADVAQGAAVAPTICQLLSDERIATVHIHNAKQGCYTAQAARA